MTVREYIGARYVPLYIGEWDNTKAYEPLSIVTYQGDSYTSRQAVPIGIEITNETYWVLSAAYNAQVETYRQEVLNVSNALPLNDFDSINTIKKYIDDAVGDIDDIIPSSDFDSTNTVKKYIDDAVGDIDAKKLKVTKEQNLLCIGDSFGAVSMTPTYGAWAESLKSMNLFKNVYNFCFQGCGFITAVAPKYKNYYQLIEEASADSSFENADIDQIVIQGGINDVANLSSLSDYASIRDSFISGVINTIEKARTEFPNARITLVPFTMGCRPNISELWVSNAAGDCITNAMSRGVNVAPNPWAIFHGISAFCGADGFHPSDLGAVYMAGYIYANIIGHLDTKWNIECRNFGSYSGFRWFRRNGNTVTFKQYEIGYPIGSGASYVDVQIPQEAVPMNYSNGLHRQGMFDNQPCDFEFKESGGNYFIRLYKPGWRNDSPSDIVYSVEYSFEIF